MIPSDERAHWDAAAEEARQVRAPKPPDPDQLRQGRILRRQAEMVETKCADLLEWLQRWGSTSTPANATASERAMWRCGILDALDRIHTMATWKEPDDG